jgi:phospholipid N-methyltransferase
MRLFDFLKALATNPRAMGAILPSSKYLAQEMAACIVPNEEGVIVELGAGTGVMTEAMLELNIAPDKIIAIECAPSLAEQLQIDFPLVKILKGDAAQLTDLLKDESRPVTTILSSLPLRSLTKEERHAILSEISSVLIPNGQYIQFTYDIRSHKGYYPAHYHLTKSQVVWKNIPPAKIEVFSVRDEIGEA